MSSPAPALRDELTTALGNKSTHYWDTLSSYLGGKISRTEFEELIREAVDTPHLGMFSSLCQGQRSTETIGICSKTTQLSNNLCARFVSAPRTPHTAAGCTRSRQTFTKTEANAAWPGCRRGWRPGCFAFIAAEEVGSGDG